jgi:hypothetical protein
MEEVESHSHLSSITSYIFYLIEIEVAYFMVLGAVKETQISH